MKTQKLNCPLDFKAVEHNRSLTCEAYVVIVALKVCICAQPKRKVRNMFAVAPPPKQRRDIDTCSKTWKEH